jgi:hypothetical protein
MFPVPGFGDVKLMGKTNGFQIAHGYVYNL